MAIYSSVNRGMYGHMAGAPGGPSIFLDYVYPRNIFHYIRRLDITEEYKFILLGTNEYMGRYSSVNQGI
jgi:hypothetical protein